MPSDVIVPVVEVRKIREHPAADMLSVVEVLGYQLVTSLVEDPAGPIMREFLPGVRDERGNRVPVPPREPGFTGPTTEQIRYRFRYTEAQRAVYFPADTVLPDKWVDAFGVRPYVKSGNRIGRARLRGEPSFGLIVELPPDGQDWEVGKNVADYYGAAKYAPPPREKQEDFAVYDSEIDSLFEQYTHIQNGKLLFGKFLPNEEVVATEKIHGRNLRVGIVNGNRVAGSCTARKAQPADADISKNMFWSPWASTSVVQLLEHYAGAGAKAVILFGEVYGAGVQSMNYGVTKGRGFRAFDIYLDGRYLDFDTFATVCDRFGVERVPVLYRGPFDFSTIQGVAEGPTVVGGGSHIREGTVVRPVIERRDPALGRVCLKWIGVEYDLSKHKDKDTTDV